MIDVVFTELKWRYEGNEGTWIATKPTHVLTTFPNNRQSYSISFMDKSAGHIDSIDKVDEFIKLFQDYVDHNPEIKERYDLLQEHRAKLGKESDAVVEKIRKIKNRVELGEMLKGTCSSCPKRYDLNS